MAAPLRGPDLRGDRASRPDLRRALRRSTASASPAVSRRSGPTSRCSSQAGAARARRRPIDVAMTTNGATLRTVADDLRDAGLDRINISLDTLDREKFDRMTRRDELDNVLYGIDAAKSRRLRPGQDQRGHRARRQRRRDRRPRRVRSRTGRRGPLHRVHAARRRATNGSNARWSVRTRSSRQLDEVCPLEVCRPAAPLRRPVALPRRRLHGTPTPRRADRRHPDGHQAVLRRL